MINPLQLNNSIGVKKLITRNCDVYVQETVVEQDVPRLRMIAVVVQYLFI